MGVPSAGFEANWYNLHFQGRNTPFQAFFGGSAAVGKTRKRNPFLFKTKTTSTGLPWRLFR